MIKSALIGTSGYAALYLKTLLDKHESGQIILSDIISIHYHNDDELNDFKAKGISFHDSLDAFFSEKRDIDLLCIPTSIYSHFEIAKRGLEHGYNLMLEKPAAATFNQIQELQKLALVKGVEAYVGYQNLYEPETWRIKEAIINGELGEIQSAHLLGLWPRSEDYFKRNEWAGKIEFKNKPVFDSVVHNAFAHFVNLALFWTGNEFNASNETISAKGNLLRAYDIESFDSASVCLNTENKIPIYINVSHACAKNVDPLIRINGTNGSLIWTGSYYEINNKRHIVAPTAEKAIERARQLMFDSVFNLMQGKEAFGCSLSLAVSLTKTVGLLHSEIEIQEEAFDVFETLHGKQRVIKGIDSRMKEAFEKGMLI